MIADYDQEDCEAVAAANALASRRKFSAIRQAEQDRVRDQLRKERDEQADQPKSQWETVFDGKGPWDCTDRMRVPGGWLYRTVFHPESESAASSVALAFVPEPRQ